MGADCWGWIPEADGAIWGCDEGGTACSCAEDKAEEAACGCAEDEAEEAAEVPVWESIPIAASDCWRKARKRAISSGPKLWPII